MTVRPAYAAVVFMCAFLLFPASIRSSQAQETTIVSPNAYENIEGEGHTEVSCCPPFRYQQVFPAEEFAALGNQPHWIVGFSWRPDQIVMDPRTVQFPDNEIRLSTTHQGPGNLSLQFDDNLGSDVTQFYRGAMIAMSDAQGPGPGPRDFYHVDFPAGVTPFLYDPSQGNLLFDVISWQGESPSGLADQVPLIRTALYASDPLATQGDRGAATVFQFTFVPVPEPSTALIAFVGCLALGTRKSVRTLFCRAGR